MLKAFSERIYFTSILVRKSKGCVIGQDKETYVVHKTTWKNN